MLGLDEPSDWTVEGAELASGPRHVQGTGSLALSNLTYATLTSTALSTLGADQVGNIIGFDIQIPEFQPNEFYFGAVQLYLELPSHSMNNVFIGQKELTYLPRETFRRVEFALTQDVQAALRGNYSDLRLRIALNTPGGTGPYLLDRISFTHEESEPIDDSRNADILGFERVSGWLASAGEASLSSSRTEGKFSLSVLPSGWTVLTSERLATPSEVSEFVGFDLHVPLLPPDTAWFGETQLYVDLPSQRVFNAYIGRHELAPLPAEVFHRVTYTLPADIVEKLDEPFDDLRFKIVLNTPTENAPYVMDRFRFGSVKEPAETIELPLPVPRNVGLSDLLLLATDSLNVGPGVRIEPGFDPRLAVAALGAGGVSLGAGSEVQSVVSHGPVSAGANAKVRGYVSGAEQLSIDPTALVWGEVTGERAPLVAGSVTATFLPSTTDVFVDSESSTVLDPGSYRSVEVRGGVLLLRPGRYSIERLMLGPDGAIEYDSRQGLPVLAVRTIMQLQGDVLDRAVEAGLAPLGPPTWLYMGRDDLELGVPPGRVFAPAARVRVTLPPSTSGPHLFWGVAARRIDLSASSGLAAVLPAPRSRSNVSEGTLLGKDGWLQDPNTENDPYTTFLDNPWWHGSFEWQPGESATDAVPPWFNTGEWHGIDIATLTLWRNPVGQPRSHAWSAPLMPGYFFHALSALIPGANNPNQAPPEWSRAQFTTRAFDLWHGAIFELAPAIVHSNGVRVTPGAGAPSLFVRLSNEVQLVPVVVIHWDGEDFVDAIRTLFDFLPSRQIAPDSTPPVRPPPGPYRSPGGVDFPPDDIWLQCGIQFQIVKALHLGPPEIRPVATSALCAAGVAACCTAEEVQDYVSHEELSRRLHDALGSEFDAIFGTGGLAPILMQYGTPRVGKCSDIVGGYFGKSAVAVLAFADVHTGGMIQINDAQPNTTAHELAHILLSQSGHTAADSERLIHPSGSGRLLTPAECDKARAVASNFSQRYLDYNRARGMTDPFSLPTPGSSFPGAVDPGFVSTENQLVCCDHGEGQKSEMLAGLCLPPRGSVTTDCTVCCNVSGNDFARVDHDECDPRDVVADDPVSGDQCRTVCCELGDREETIPSGECARIGEPCVAVCCEIDGTRQDLNRGECVRRGGEEIFPGQCNPA